ncbi:MAG: HAD-IIIC family phosphatase [Lachnospiraceae bacterium]|nr:HAD-IIIC family phosphatase [Lachnospiraceae bacterium]
MNQLTKLPAEKLLKLAKRLEKDPSGGKAAGEKPVRFAVLGSASIQHFVKVLRLFLDNEGINAEIYEGEYGGIEMDVLDEASPLYAFGADFVLLLPRFSDFPMESEKDLEEAKAHIERLWSALDRIPGVTILQGNTAIPLERPLGALEAANMDSSLSLFRRFNLSLTENHPENVRILDLEYLSSACGKRAWFDETAWFLSKQGFSLEFLGPVAAEVSRMTAASLGRTRKCLVLDLDNTLWGGVIGDDGPLGINVDPNDPLGEAYRAFQSYILRLKNRGVLLAVNSKNDEALAKEAFTENPDMILKLSDIACFVANWDNKAQNMSLISKKLNIGLDSLVFFDDNPAERELIKMYCPAVTVIDVPEEPEAFVRVLDDVQPFEWAAVTEEDKVRTASYLENEKREDLAARFVDYREYLKALKMEAHCGEVSKTELSRFAQLINKSNQFNLRTRRYSESEIAEMMKDSRVKCLYISLKDTFTTYGVISCIILKFPSGEEGLSDTDCFIDTWCMSCRVLKRTVEELALRFMVRVSREMGADRLAGEYIRTKKNGMVESLLPRLGFTGIEAADRVLYGYDLNKKPEGELWIKEI